MNLTTKQEYKDFFYGKALRLADELGCWDQAILDMMFFTSVEQYRAYCVELEEKLYEEKICRKPLSACLCCQKCQKVKG